MAEMDYNQQGDVAVLTLDDGKANAISPAFVDAVNEGLDRAGDEAKSVLITGRPGMFSGGFDLKEYPVVRAWLGRVEATPAYVPMRSK